MKLWIASAALVVLLSLPALASEDAVPAEYAVGANPQALVVGDFNGDGRPDLAVLNCGDTASDSSTVSVLLGNPDGTFQAARIFAAGYGPYIGSGSNRAWLHAGDLDGDAKLDLIATVSLGQSYVLLGRGDGTFQAAQWVPLPRQSPPVPTLFIKPESS